MFLAKGNLVVKKQGGWQAVGLTSDPGLIEFRFQSGRGLPQSMTLPRVTGGQREVGKAFGAFGCKGASHMNCKLRRIPDSFEFPTPPRVSAFSQLGVAMARAFSPWSLYSLNLGRWPRLVCSRAVGARGSGVGPDTLKEMDRRVGLKVFGVAASHP